LCERFAGCFRRRDHRHRAVGYLRGLLGQVHRKNAWQLAEYLDYGTLPDQRRSFFTVAKAPKMLGGVYAGMGEDGALQAGLETLVTELLQREWPRAILRRIERLRLPAPAPT